MLDQVDRSAGIESCWPWKASIDKNGYGEIRIDHATYFAHRVSFVVLGQKPLRDDQIVRHSCDNPICCNPGHLLAGVQAENVKNMIERNRQQDYTRVNKGSEHPMATIDDSMARLIFETNGIGHRAIAKRLGVSYHIVRRIKTGLTWTHVTGMTRRYLPSDPPIIKPGYLPEMAAE